MAKIPPGTIQAYRKVTTASVADALWEQGTSGPMTHDIKPIFPVKIVGPELWLGRHRPGRGMAGIQRPRRGPLT